jgi:hypothetical protein
MIRAFALAAAVTVALASSASADFVFTDMGTNPTPIPPADYNPAVGFDISSGGASGHPQHYEGMKFTALGNYNLTSYEVAFANVGGTYTGGLVQLQLTGDSGGAGPDFTNIIDTKQLTATAAADSIGSVVANGTVLNGITYWLVATMVSPDSAIVWAQGNNPLTAPANGVFQGTAPPGGNLSTQNQAGYRIQGTLIPTGVPEPSSFALAAISAGFGLGTWGWRRRRTQQTVAAA